MTLSILIPVYNDDAQALVAKVLEQVSALRESVEVIVADDYSTTDTAWLDGVALWPNVRVCRNARNLGRAANRNGLAAMAQGQWLLYLDAGNVIADPDFLAKYYAARDEADIVVGGVAVSEATCTPQCSLRWRYEHQAARRYHDALAAHRSLDDWPFRSAAFLVRRDVMARVAFDERLVGYGYEDVLFGIEARQCGITVAHIDAPIELDRLESNDVFLAKTQEALTALYSLRSRIGSHSPLVRLSNLLEAMHLSGAVRLAYRLLRKPLRCNLLSPDPSLRVFAFYKLGFYLTIAAERSHKMP